MLFLPLKCTVVLSLGKCMAERRCNTRLLSRRYIMRTFLTSALNFAKRTRRYFGFAQEKHARTLVHRTCGSLAVYKNFGPSDRDRNSRRSRYYIFRGNNEKSFRRFHDERNEREKRRKSVDESRKLRRESTRARALACGHARCRR